MESMMPSRLSMRESTRSSPGERGLDVELSGAILAGDLAVAELVGPGDQLGLEEVEADAGVGLGPVVPVAEVERVDVPVVDGVVGLDDLDGELVGAADESAARLAGAEEGVAVHLFGGGIVDDEARLDVAVVLADPHVDPEGLAAHDLLLLAAHAARDIHHVEDDGGAAWLGVDDEGAVAAVVLDGDDDRAPRS